MTENSGERADRYLRIAHEARALANRSDEAKLIAAYTDLAETWERMAREASDGPDGPAPKGGSPGPR